MQPETIAAAVAIPVTSPGSASTVPDSKERQVPVRTTRSGRTLKAVPPWMDATETTAGERGGSRRETTDWSACTTFEAARTASDVSWGEAACPPRPVTSIENSSTAAIIGPAITPTVPNGSGVQRWRPKTTSGRGSARTPSAIIEVAPPVLSSAGWKAKTIRPRSGGSPRRRSAAMSSAAMWPSCPQACIFPLVEANGRPVRSATGSASSSARRSTVRPGRPVSRRAARPVLPRPVLTVRPRARIRPATSAAVSTSSKAVSGRA